MQIIYFHKKSIKIIVNATTKKKVFILALKIIKISLKELFLFRS